MNLMTIGSIREERKKCIEISFQVHANTLPKDVANQALGGIISDYTRENDLICSLKYFAITTLSKLNSSLNIVEVVDEPGYSGDKVYRVINSETNQIQTILKIFKVIGNNFFAEVFALKYLRKAHFSNFSSPKIQAVGLFALQEGSYYILSETVAPGLSLLSHIRNGSDNPITARAVYKCGLTLAELHLHASGPPQPFPLAFEVRAREYLAKSMESLRKYPYEGIDQEKLIPYFEKALFKLKMEELPTCVTHGDTKMSNVFYDDRADKVTWIDPPNVAGTIHPEGPSGIPGRDFYAFFADLNYQQYQFFMDQDKLCQKNISDEELSGLQNLFTEGYKAAGGSPPSKNQLDFFSFSAYLYFISADTTRNPTFKVNTPADAFKVNRMKKIFADLANRL